MSQSTNTTDIVVDSPPPSPRRRASIDPNSDQDEPPGTGDGPELASSSDDRVRN